MLMFLNTDIKLLLF